MGVSLILRDTGRATERRYELQLRFHDLGGTDYATIAAVNAQQAQLLCQAGRHGISWLSGEPDYAKHAKELELTKARNRVADLERELDK